MLEAALFGLVTLDDSNWTVWMSQTRNVLGSRGLQDLIDKVYSEASGKAEDDRADQSSKSQNGAESVLDEKERVRQCQ